MDDPLLFQAAKNGHASIVKMLLANGADASKCRDAVTRAEAKGHTEVVELLAKATSRKGALLKFLGGCFSFNKFRSV